MRNRAPGAEFRRDPPPALPSAFHAPLDIAISDSYPTPMKVSVADAKNKLPELIKAVENGETVTICRRGVPTVDLVRTKEPVGKIQNSEHSKTKSKSTIPTGGSP